MNKSETATTDSLTFLKGKKVILRPLETTDIGPLQVWINNEELRRNFLVFRPMSREDEQDWFEKIRKDPQSFLFAMCAHDGTLIGNIGLIAIDWVHRFATSGTLIGDPNFRNKGYGTDAKMLLLNYAFNTLNLNRVNSGAIEFNERSQRYNQKCGYKIEGRERAKYFKDGKYWDHIVLGVLREEWLPLWDEYQKDPPTA
jgi:RimJ/RimL family protein N-acetyltransferase